MSLEGMYETFYLLVSIAGFVISFVHKNLFFSKIFSNNNNDTFIFVLTEYRIVTVK